jgi:hypothetical protein
MISRYLNEVAKHSLMGRAVRMSLLFPRSGPRPSSLIHEFYFGSHPREAKLCYALCGPVLEPASLVADAVRWQPGHTVEDHMWREDIRCLVLADEVHRWSHEHSEILAKMLFRNPRLSLLSVGLEGEHEMQSPLMALPSMVRVYPQSQSIEPLCESH